MSMVPPEIWGSHVPKDTDNTKVGCVYCALENKVFTPLVTVYYWHGISMCSKHLSQKVQI